MFIIKQYMSTNIYQCYKCGEFCNLVIKNIIYTNIYASDDIFNNEYRYYCQTCYSLFVQKIDTPRVFAELCKCGNYFASDCQNSLCRFCCDNITCFKHNGNFSYNARFVDLYNQNVRYNMYNILSFIPKNIIDIIAIYTNPTKKGAKNKIYMTSAFNYKVRNKYIDE